MMLPSMLRLHSRVFIVKLHWLCEELPHHHLAVGHHAHLRSVGHGARRTLRLVEDDAMNQLDIAHSPMI